MSGGAVSPTAVDVSITPRMRPDEMQRFAADVRRVRVLRDLVSPGLFEIEVENADPISGRFTWSEASDLAPGARVAISLGELGSTHQVISGEVTGLAPVFSEGGDFGLTIRGYDLGHRLNRSRHTRRFEDKTYTQIARTLAKASGLRFSGDDSAVPIPLVTQAAQTDWVFLHQLAARCGFECFVDGGKLEFRRPRRAARAVRTFEFGNDLLEFRPRLTTVGVATEVSVQGMEPGGRDMIRGRARVGQEADPTGPGTTASRLVQREFGSASGVLLDNTVASQAEADALAAAELDRRSMGLIRGEIDLRGQPGLAPGHVVDIAGVGDRFGGTYYVSSVTHTVYRGGVYRTTATVTRNVR